MSPSERDEIIALVTRLQEQNAELMAANEELRRQLAESHRSGRRQAAPFSKGKRSSKPKRPGRKPGMGLFSYRKPPSAEESHRAGCRGVGVGGHMPRMWRQPCG